MAVAALVRHARDRVPVNRSAIGEAGALGSAKRRGWDSNPRGTQGPVTVFETAPYLARLLRLRPLWGRAWGTRARTSHGRPSPPDQVMPLRFAVAGTGRRPASMRQVAIHDDRRRWLGSIGKRRSQPRLHAPSIGEACSGALSGGRTVGCRLCRDGRKARQAERRRGAEPLKLPIYGLVSSMGDALRGPAAEQEPLLGQAKHPTGGLGWSGGSGSCRSRGCRRSCR